MRCAAKAYDNVGRVRPPTARVALTSVAARATRRATRATVTGAGHPKN